MFGPFLLLAVPGLAHSQTVSGLYLSAGSGLNFMPTQIFNADAQQSALVSPRGATLLPASNTVVRSHNDFDTGGVAVASIGYGFGNGIRLELEADYRYNAESAGLVRAGVDVREQKFGGMANGLYDFDIGSSYVYPYFGAGAGFMRVDRAYGPKPVHGPAYQGIAGVAFPMPWVSGLSLTLEYRFMGLVDVNGSAYRAATLTTPAVSATGSYENDMNHSLMVGVRYAFGGS